MRDVLNRAIDGDPWPPPEGEQAAAGFADRRDVAGRQVRVLAPEVEFRAVGGLHEDRTVAPAVTQADLDGGEAEGEKLILIAVRFDQRRGDWDRCARAFVHRPAVAWQDLDLREVGLCIDGVDAVGELVGAIGPEDVAVAIGDETHEDPEAHVGVVIDGLDGLDDAAEASDGVGGHKVIAEGDVEVDVACGRDAALVAGADGAELGVAAVEAEGEGHVLLPVSTRPGAKPIVRDVAGRSRGM